MGCPKETEIGKRVTWILQTLKIVGNLLFVYFNFFLITFNKELIHEVLGQIVQR